MLLFVVARTRLDRYEELRRHFEDWRDVRVKSDPVSLDTELARMTVTKEAGHEDEAEEAGAVVGAVQYAE